MLQFIIRIVYNLLPVIYVWLNIDDLSYDFCTISLK